MKKVLKSLPSPRFIGLAAVGCYLLGVAMTNDFVKGLWGLGFAALFIAMATLRNSDPMAWEAYHEPHAYNLRLQRDMAVRQLEALLDAQESGDASAVQRRVREARNLLAELPRPTTAQ